jgi:hypothetical protein
MSLDRMLNESASSLETLCTLNKLKVGIDTLFFASRRLLDGGIRSPP